ncbi:MAG: NAD(P)-dependent oxidoreductase [Bacteroidales bacterium]|jgi:D-3-phosphoglycerate dehydrogenase|nr:NAD(P)-dependent oxidoreductase [Bacteroidales bacterium]MDI9575793.1 NAD(P)-dependent oxidoreductase [Bacteroidota bacterium]HHW59114.1 3-phosphoglycerate dehydrogenase [Bacteroidales bacterium]HOB77490.1 NAD(P)-dependent oxidoreductase [Bacteroidales bacterium]HPZ60905.1 NAD(P)-dependent oxidoreductase [Bacteroidales bacterium]
MNKIVVLTEKPFAADAVNKMTEIAKAENFEIKFIEKYTSKEEAYKGVKEANALIVRSDIVDKDLISHAPNLKIVVRAGAGYDNIDLNACTERNIVAMNTPGQNSNAVAELALALMLYISRNQFDGSVGTELKGKTLGLHGFGYTAKALATLVKGFDMKIYGHRRSKRDDEYIAYNVTKAESVEDLYKNSQYVSLHIPANDATIKSINYNLLSLMPKNAVLVNTARKELINEDDLLKVLEERPDFRYVSDVAPDCKNIIAEKYPGRCYFTPKKLGAQTKEANNNAGLAAIRQIIAFFKTGDTTFQINK